MLKLADNLSLPLNAITDTFAILAIRGAGKSHTASVMAEEMLKAGQPIVAYDPTGAWWGLKSSADGRSPGFPVVVFGGEHADVPLEETAGDTIASTIIEQRIPAILDCSLMRKAARVRFMTDFAETLYHKNREPLHLFLDEAHTVAPQNIRAMPEASRLLGAIEDIILQGRRRGLGLTAISPRPAVVNANVRSACQTLVAMRVGSGKLDRKAIEEWVEAHGDAETAKEMMASLAGLPTGDAWVWNPPAKIFKRVHFRERETFDSSATPKVGGRVVTPNRMAEIDLDALGDKIKATIEKAKADDPRELKKKIAEQAATIKKLEARPAAKAEPKVIEKPVIREQDFKALHKVVDNLAVVVRSIREQVEAITDPVRTLEAAVATAHKAANAAMYQPKGVPDAVRIRDAADRKPEPRTALANVNGSNGKRRGKRSAEERVLDALRWWESLGVEFPSRMQVGLVAKVNASGGYFDNVVRPLVEAGHIERDSGTVHLLASGRAIGQEPPPVKSMDEYHAVIRDQIRDGASQRMFDALVAHGNRPIDRATLGDAAAVNYSGGYFDNVIRPLATLGVVTRAGGRVTPTALLFPPELA